jgi:hypothetical protein
VEVTDRNLEVAMTMSGGTDINARLVAVEGVTPPTGKITITVSQVAGSALGSQMVAAGPDGQFLIRGLPDIRHQVSVNGLMGKFYVKEIRYNGVVVTDGIITPIPGAPGQLDIVIDDHAATISGSVAERDKVSGGVMVTAVKWPVSSGATSLSMLASNASVMADDQGRFQIGGLAPGEYRLMATPVGSLSRLPPDTVSGAEKVTLERGGSQSVSLKIVEP